MRSGRVPLYGRLRPRARLAGFFFVDGPTAFLLAPRAHAAPAAFSLIHWVYAPGAAGAARPPWRMPGGNDGARAHRLRRSLPPFQRQPDATLMPGKRPAIARLPPT